LNIDQLKEIKPGTLLKILPTGFEAGNRYGFTAVLNSSFERKWIKTKVPGMFLYLIFEKNSNEPTGYAKILIGQNIYYIFSDDLGLLKRT